MKQWSRNKFVFLFPEESTRCKLILYSFWSRYFKQKNQGITEEILYLLMEKMKEKSTKLSSLAKRLNMIPQHTQRYMYCIL